MNDKKMNVSLLGLDNLDKETLELLIDSLVEYYTNIYGIELDDLAEPEKPIYETETITDATEYLKKFRLKGTT
jgi:phenylalanyl-tRNA synthetase beta subunit